VNSEIEKAIKEKEKKRKPAGQTRYGIDFGVNTEDGV
jgi:hypothetical protein